MKIEILGTGCPKCSTLAANAEEAARSLGVSYELHKVTKLDEILARGVVFTPALAVDGEVKLSGKVAGVEEISKLLESSAR